MLCRRRVLQPYSHRPTATDSQRPIHSNQSIATDPQQTDPQRPTNLATNWHSRRPIQSVRLKATDSQSPVHNDQSTAIGRSVSPRASIWQNNSSSSHNSKVRWGSEAVGNLMEAPRQCWEAAVCAEQGKRKGNRGGVGSGVGSGEQRGLEIRRVM